MRACMCNTLEHKEQFLLKNNMALFNIPKFKVMNIHSAGSCTYIFDPSVVMAV